MYWCSPATHTQLLLRTPKKHNTQHATHNTQHNTQHTTQRYWVRPTRLSSGKLDAVDATLLTGSDAEHHAVLDVAGENKATRTGGVRKYVAHSAVERTRQGEHTNHCTALQHLTQEMTPARQPAHSTQSPSARTHPTLLDWVYFTAMEPRMRSRFAASVRDPVTTCAHGVHVRQRTQPNATQRHSITQRRLLDRCRWTRCLLYTSPSPRDRG